MNKLIKVTCSFFVAVLAMLTMNHNVLTEAATIDYEDGTYDIIAKALHEDKDEPSTAADYINEEAEVIIKNGKLDLKITVPKNDQFSIYALHKQGDEQTKEEDEDNLYYFFHLDEQNIEEAIINVVASYEVPDMDFTHEDVNFRFQLEGLDDLPVIAEDDESSDDNSDENQEDEAEDNQDKDDESQTEEPKGDEEDSDENSEVNPDEDEKGSGDQSEVGADDELDSDDYIHPDADKNENKTADNNSNNETEKTIIIKALHADKDEPSAAADYINEEASVSIDNDGKYSLTITVPKDEFFTIYGMQIDGATVSEEEDNENVYYTFKMDELSEILYAHTQYEVPAFNLDHDVDFRFQIENMDDVPVENDQNENTEDPNNEEDDSDNKETVQNRGDIGQNKGTFLTNGKNKTAQKFEAENGNKDKSKSLDKPEFGSSDKVNSEVVNDEKQNPQTGDYSQVLFYGFILIGSIVLLIIQLRKRFVHT